MKRFLMLFFASALLLSCGKPAEAPKPAILLSVMDVGSRSATVAVSCEGPDVALLRLTEAVRKEEWPAGMDAEATINYLKTKGSAVTLPYKSALKELFPSTDYVIGAISFDGNMDLLTWTTVEFKTEDLGTSTVGDPSGAGSLSGNELEDKDKGGE